MTDKIDKCLQQFENKKEILKEIQKKIENLLPHSGKRQKQSIQTYGSKTTQTSKPGEALSWKPAAARPGQADSDGSCWGKGRLL